MMRVAVTGASGFIGKNLVVRFGERPAEFEVIPLSHTLGPADLTSALAGCDAVVHLAGVNRPREEAEFASGNAGFTQLVVDALTSAGSTAPVIYASSIHAERDTPYGRSKSTAEVILDRHGKAAGVPVRVVRLPNVFGKWSRPNYNSVVATFCHNIAHDLPLTTSDQTTLLSLLYVDDLVDWIVAAVGAPAKLATMDEPGPVYKLTLGALAATLQGFRQGRSNLTTDRVGTGLARALHATYLSYLDPAAFAYEVPSYADARGRFVEMLKTQDSGQFSYFTAHPGVTRGGHYHHSKTEKFLVVSGEALFRFRNILTGEQFELATDGERPRIVETAPGWAHNITNVGDQVLVVMLWANEVFDRNRPDTIAAVVS